jgi:hypothetical protein
MDPTYKLLFTGELRPGFEPDNVINALVEDMGLAVEKADKLVNARRPVTVKRGVDKPKGEQLGKRLARTGLTMKLVKNAEQKAAKSASDQAASEAPTKQAEADLSPTPSDNPYAAPVANLEQQAPVESSQQGDPQKLGASHGWKWVKDAYSMFKEHPWAYMGAFFSSYFIVGLFSLIPFLGMFLGYIVMPIIMGGLMIGVHEQKEGGSFRLRHIFSGFSNNRNQLLLLGCLITIGFFVCFIPFLFFFGMSFFTGNFDPETMSGLNMSMLPIMLLLGFGISIPLYMAMWFAPTLVAVNDHKAWPALKLSFQACKKNMLPFLVYSIVFMGLFVGIMVIFGIGASIVMPQFNSIDNIGSTIFVGIAVVVILMALMVPTMATMGLSVYTAYRDIFYS